MQNRCSFISSLIYFYQTKKPLYLFFNECNSHNSIIHDDYQVITLITESSLFHPAEFLG